ncbi:hypothetical protein HN51_070124 [Arachis hypogaea]|uniref:uncharacterized protein n=1 Tax=Arachis hypogaea TaxID=3818 RepID=UPI0007AF464F|nr:uncharacterized protein LOC107643828 isoform X1 [Arachis ipaensis]XP_025655131.1 uncharacterized protein LOC112750558 isoform X1 [Arachis hypogaea]QHO12458.1 uncharacterized protein DS421_15g507080 [Arachis hypogaea]
MPNLTYSQTMTTMTTTTSSPPLLCSFLAPKQLLLKPSLSLPQSPKSKPLLNSFSAKPPVSKARSTNSRTVLCFASRRKPVELAEASPEAGSDGNFRRIFQIALWVAEAVYILWLFLLPYAPGDPVWAISSETVNNLVGLSLNFFFILPFMNFVGIHLIEAPVLHPMAEGLFNFVIAWTFMFAPVLYTDCRRDRYKGSLDVLWGLQMFLTNTFLIPYMAIRLNNADNVSGPSKRSELGSLMTNGASYVGLIGGITCIVSILWALYGRTDANFGGIADRWEFLVGFFGSERLAYAFIWDICLYMIFQPWLLGDNLQNVQEDKVVLVNYLRYIPVVGIIAYLLCLEPKKV